MGGIKEMGGLPAVMFVIDTNKEEIAIREARKLNIPVVAVVDSNCDPELIDYPIPGNDDAARAISLYLDLISHAVIAGLQKERQEDGEDLGAAEELPAEEAGAVEEAVAGPEAEVSQAAPNDTSSAKKTS